MTIAPILWTSVMHGRPANVCVDGCRILQCCYEELGIRSEIVAVDLVVTDDAGRTVMHATPQPHWHGNQLEGHCVLYLPDDQRLVDATVEQYREISRLKMGPIVARKSGIELGSGSIPRGKQHAARRAARAPPC